MQEGGREEQKCDRGGQNEPEDTRGISQASRDITLRSPPIREAESAIGVFRNALGMCKRGARRSKSAIGVAKTGPKTCLDMLLEAQSAIGVFRHALGTCKNEADRSESAIGVVKTGPGTLAGSRSRLAT